MVTAEFAVALPAFVLVVVAALCGVGAMTAQLRCADAAAIAARMAARGEAPALVRATALRGVPGRTGLEVESAGGIVTVTVRSDLVPSGLAHLLPDVAVHAAVSEAVEPASPDAGPTEPAP